IDLGDYPGVGEPARAGWAAYRDEVRTLAAAVVATMDLDRNTAGRRWCKRVQQCLDAGWKLLNMHARSVTGFRVADEVDQYESELATCRKHFETIYNRVV